MFYHRAAFIFVVVLVQVQENCANDDVTTDVDNSTAADNTTTNDPVPDSTDEFKGPAAWLRICQPGTGKYVGAVSASENECPAGYWFKDPMKVGCVCGHGVWVFARGWCDHTARIIIAKDGSCFNINKDVKYIRNIGWPQDAFMPYHFVATSGLEYIQDIPEPKIMSEKATHFHPEYNQHIGAIFRERAVESVTGRFCVSNDGTASPPLAFKYFVPKLPYYEKQYCFSYANQDLSNFEYDLGFSLNEGLTLTEAMARPYSRPKPWAMKADSEKCKTECPSGKPLYLKGREDTTIDEDYVDPSLDEYFVEELKDMGWVANENNSLPDAMPDQKCDREYTLSNKTLIEIQEQTKRMIRLNVKSSVKDEISPRVKFADYKLLQKARTILNKVCPESELPSTVLTGMHRMFRIAVNESFFRYPFNQLGDDSETEEILNTLNTCFADAKPMTFIYTDQSNSSDETKCKDGKFTGVNYEFQTNTTSFTRTIMAKLPCHLWSNITELDLVVETAWKTVMFAHYYCARHFKMNSVGFSVFEQKMERFFNRWIQHRWFYPGSALQGYKYIYQMFNLEKFGNALDNCVAAARSFSVYRKWIRRPSYSKSLGGKLFEEQFEIPDSVAGRTTLDALNPQLNQFDNKAYCLPYWHAPASNPGLNYNPARDYKPGCVKYVKEEWLDPFTPVLDKSFGWRDSVDII